MTLSIGKITPPYGISLLLACTIAEIPLAASMRWTVVFLVAFCLLVAALIGGPTSRCSSRVSWSPNWPAAE